MELREKGLNGFQIKLIALGLMLLDHIHYFFEFTNRVPLAFSWLGRLAGGLFLFTMIEGYSHTSNRKKYFTRIYLMGVLMSLVKYLIQFIPLLQRADGFVPENGIFQTFTVLLVIYSGIDLIRDKNFGRGILRLLAPFLLMYSYIIPLQLLPIPMNIKNIIFIVLTSIFPPPFMVEGGIYVLAMGLILYIFKDNRRRQLIAFSIFTLAWMIGLPVFVLKANNLKIMFTDYYEWMGVFAVIPMALYNGKKGRGMKGLFYIFYPLHIYLLYIISVLIY